MFIKFNVISFMQYKIKMPPILQNKDTLIKICIA